MGDGNVSHTLFSDDLSHPNPTDTYIKPLQATREKLLLTFCSFRDYPWLVRGCSVSVFELIHTNSCSIDLSMGVITKSCLDAYCHRCRKQIQCHQLFDCMPSYITRSLSGIVSSSFLPVSSLSRVRWEVKKMASLCVMQIIDGSKTLKRWYGKCLQRSLKLCELFSEFSSGQIDNGVGIPEKYRGCKVCDCDFMCI